MRGKSIKIFTSNLGLIFYITLLTQRTGIFSGTVRLHIITIAVMLVAFFGLGPVILADASTSERMITLLVVLLIYLFLGWIVKGYMRINTLSELLNVKQSSATKMVQKLTELGFLDY